MTRTTQQLREIYAPACSSRRRTGWFLAYSALDHVFRRHRYAPKRGQTGAQNCRKITGGSGYSLHAYFDDERITFWSGVAIAIALATDINWLTNPYGRVLHTDMSRAMIDDVYRIRTARSHSQVFRWGGYYTGNKDAMHFEIVASPAELAEGLVILYEDGVVYVTGEEEDDMTPAQEAKVDKLIALLEEKEGGKTYEHLDILQNQVTAIAQHPGAVLTFKDDGTVATVDGVPM